jgi:hypothetical protein
MQMTASLKIRVQFTGSQQPATNDNSVGRGFHRIFVMKEYALLQTGA